MNRRFRNFFRRKDHIDANELNGFLHNASGVIHVGANAGQEREIYSQCGLRVLWVEPLPDVFAALQANIADFPEQRALQCLVTDVDGKEYAFHIADNDGLSSSIYDLKLHKDIWPDVAYERVTPMRSKTLTTLLKDEAIDPSAYDALIMDTQGSELLVLKGAVALLKHIDYIKTEVADFEAYEGCCQLDDIDAFATAHGYHEAARKVIAEHETGGAYYDVVYAKDRLR